MPPLVSYTPVGQTLGFQGEELLSGQVAVQPVYQTYLAPNPPLVEIKTPFTDEDPYADAKVRVQDMPNCNTISGAVVALHWVMITLSCFICLVRSDYNFVFYLGGYYIWAIEGDRHGMSSLAAASAYPGTSEIHITTKKMYRNVKSYLTIYALAVVVDVAWLALGFSTFMCDSKSDNCWIKSSKLLYMTINLHQAGLYLSVVNAFLKVRKGSVDYAVRRTRSVGFVDETAKWESRSIHIQHYTLPRSAWVSRDEVTAPFRVVVGT